MMPTSLISSKAEGLWAILGLPFRGLGRFSANGTQTGPGRGGSKNDAKTFLFVAPVPLSLILSKTKRYWPIFSLPLRGLSRFWAARILTGSRLGGRKMMEKKRTKKSVPVPA